MMTVYTALLRGVNVGGKKMIKMADLRGVVAFLMMLAGIVLVGGIVACSTQSTANDAVAVVKKNLEARKNNDFEAWASTLWPAEKNDQNFTPSFEKPGDLGVISLAVDKVEVSDRVTKVIKEQYSGSDLARSRGCSDEYIAENVIVVYADYTVDYDNIKVPYNEGTLTEVFTLVRDNPQSPWLIRDSAVRTLDSF